MAVLLREFAVSFIAVLLGGIECVVTARYEQLFNQAKFEETRGFGPTCAADRKKNWKVKQDPFVVDKIFLCCS